MSCRNVAALTLMLLLLGCGTYATGPLFSEKPYPQAGNSIIYIYRVDSIHMNTPMIKINDKPFVKLDKEGYSYVYLQKGLYKLTIDFGGFAYTPFITELLVEGKQEIFIRLYDTGGAIRLDYMQKEKALEEIKQYRFVEPIATQF